MANQSNGYRKRDSSFCDKISAGFSEIISTWFYRLGVFVGNNPIDVIIATLIITASCSIGLLHFYNEQNPLNLWVPTGSDFLSNSKLLMSQFKEGSRDQSVIIVDENNVLTSTNLLKLLEIHKQVVQINVTLSNGTTIGYNDICFKIPNIKIDFNKSIRQKRDTSKFNFDDSDFLFIKKKSYELDPIVVLDPKQYCGIIESFEKICYMQNVLELWEFREDVIENLSNDDIARTIDTVNVSPVTGHTFNYTSLLGEIKRNSTGNIISAKTIKTDWMLHVNFSNVDFKKTGNIAGTENGATEDIYLWEDVYLLKINELSRYLSNDNVTIAYSAGRSYGDISSKVMFQDMDKIFYGTFLMFLFMQVVLSKLSWTEIRITLGSLGLLSIGMAFISTIGVCTALGIFYGPVHTSLPFLLLGLGVDDMFVIMANWRATTKETRIPERMGLAMRHAGASITVTSVTNMIAFLVGAFTVLPCLRSFCIYASVGVAFTYFYAVTFYIAIFVLDERRIRKGCNSFIPCIVHKDPPPVYEFSFQKRWLKTIYSEFILTTIGKLVVVLTVIIFTCFNVYNVTNLQQKFDMLWFIPKTTYLHSHMQTMRTYYPNIGHNGLIVFGAMNYTDEIANIRNLIAQFNQRDDIFNTVDDWVQPFTNFTQSFYDKDIGNLSDDEWQFYLSKFLFSRLGGKYAANFKFDKDLKCGEPTPNITISLINFSYKKFNERNEYIPAMHSVNDMLTNSNITCSYKFSWAEIYGNWLTDEIIDQELFRNLFYAILCVMGCTFIIISDLLVCFWIFICIILTLVNVGGFMQLWGVTIDLVSCIGLTLATGLSVDYAAHLGHAFLIMKKGDKNQRALDSVIHIGTAVLAGGNSTLLALVLLANSEAYTFQCFFKIIFLVVLFGLSHGLIFLPVVLSVFGPKPHKKSDKMNDVIDETELRTLRPVRIETIEEHHEEDDINGIRVAKDDE